MTARPVAQRVWDGSTSTGTGTQAQFGVGHTVATALISNGSTEGVAGDVQGSLGGSTSWFSLIALTTGASTGANVAVTSTAGQVFDKARVNLSTNNTTGDLTIWVGGG